jgi:D-lyxose ketol-isomerase
MLRSEINRIIKDSSEFFRRENFHLPPFARIKPEQWPERAAGLREVIENGLGWDVTDFGLGDFYREGLLLFTIRNGDPKTAASGGKSYCEKIIHLREGQTCPTHYHKSKMEDIICRGGATLCFELHRAGSDGASFSPESFFVSQDGEKKEYPPGAVIALSAGESITLPPYLSHSFWAEGGDVLVGEVSTVNDDTADNFFHREIPRFTEITEDEPPHFLLVHELGALLK